ncbi:uncharacterized protein HMPREF1120_07510 [Exophiala dermatitidis NIH/UT8656]|uniref:Uncharacterized protein n=2 Tax=Exophiala dermatitidis TaxID=5970 RepID=H6C726_EXODN|nr:uncharacterized protein HMPREF1120_07510 [Exophiala dermatitidis NIH/UT8656]EHY59522.1 hypothetical protein HMPREF1120_07510 [Exophiala dermatitidis NIH/UT8656]
MECPPHEQILSRRPTEETDLPSLHRKYRSMENVADPTGEIAAARSRLRSVADKGLVARSSKMQRVDTLEELGLMLDDAIEDQSFMPGAFSGEVSDETPSRRSLELPPHISQTTRRQSQSRGHKSLRSTETAMPRSSEESVRVNYEERSTSQRSSQEGRYGDNHDEETLGPNSRPSPLRQGSDAAASHQLSPVKQRAAMFESFVPKPSQHEQASRRLPRAKDDTLTGKETNTVARIKFAGAIEERPGTPLIPLTLPAMVSAEQKSSKSSPPAAEELTPKEPPSTDEKAADEVFHQRKPSIGWPFKWSLFNKSPSAPVQEAESGPATVQAKNDSLPPKKSNAVQSRVQDLLQAANEKDDAEKRRRHAERERLIRREIRARPVVMEAQLIEDHVDLQGLKPTNLPPLQVPISEEVEGIMPDTKANDAPSEPRTPLQRAMTEKQVFAPAEKLESLNKRSPSPARPDPRTPARGRSRRSTHRLSTGEQRTVEQRFNLSPGSSRSRSKNGGAGLKVEVEVRDSPEREAREKGEKIVIIRANVEAVDNGE